MRLNKIIILFLVIGCDRPVPVLFADGRANPPKKYFSFVEKACNYWGFECYETSDNAGVLSIHLTDEGAIVHENEEEDIEENVVGGAEFDSKICSPVVWSSTGKFVLEHEIGHAFGLAHVKELGNVMEAEIGGDFHTEDQYDKVQLRKNMMVNCIGGHTIKEDREFLEELENENDT